MKTQSRKLALYSFLFLGLSTSATMLQAKTLKQQAREFAVSCNEYLGELPDVRVPTMLYKHKIDVEKNGPAALEVEQLIFEGTEGKDVYNNSAPFDTTVGIRAGEKTSTRQIRVIAGRVEPRANHNSEVWFFYQTERGTWAPVADMPGLNPAYVAEMKFGHRKIGNVQIHGSEDPFVTEINGETVVGFVETFEQTPGKLGYRTVFYRDFGHGLAHLERFATGPNGMKDIRLGQEKAGGPILVLTRPQNMDVDLGGRGKNAITFINSLDELTPIAIKKAHIIHDQTGTREWIGSNKVFFLKDGDIGFLSHVAYYKNEKSGLRGYYVTVYTRNHPEPRIIMVRDDLMEQSDKKVAKRPDLMDVLFSGDLHINLDPNHPDFVAGYKPGETAWLYVGVGDALSYRVLIRNPFYDKTVDDSQ